MTSSIKQADNLAMLGARTLKHSRGVSYDLKMTMRAKVMVKVNMTFRTASLLAILLFCVKVIWPSQPNGAGLGGSVGCAIRLETRRSRVHPPPRSATFFRGD